MQLPKAVHELEFNHGTIYGDEEIAAVLEVMKANAPSTGPKVKQFEEDFSKYCGAAHSLAVTSATAGLDLALIAAGVGPGDEVITTPVSWISTANAVGCPRRARSLRGRGRTHAESRPGVGRR